MDQTIGFYIGIIIGVVVAIVITRAILSIDKQLKNQARQIELLEKILEEIHPTLS